MKVWKFGDRVDTDQILSGPYLSLSNPEELGAHLFETVRPGFSAMIQKGDVLVAGKAFGCGSSREHAVHALKGAGISCVVAESFSRLFFRNAVNLGLEVIVAEDLSGIREGDRLRLEREYCRLEDIDTGIVRTYRPMPEFLRRIIQCGGLVAYAQTYLKREAAQ